MLIFHVKVLKIIIFSFINLFIYYKDNSLGDDAVARIIKALCFNQTLKTLKLYRKNKIIYFKK